MPTPRASPPPRSARPHRPTARRRLQRRRNRPNGDHHPPGPASRNQDDPTSGSPSTGTARWLHRQTRARAEEHPWRRASATSTMTAKRAKGGSGDIEGDRPAVTVKEESPLLAGVLAPRQRRPDAITEPLEVPRFVRPLH